MREQTHLNKGHAKVPKNKRIFETRDTTTGKRKVRIDDRTVIYTSCATDAEAINKFNKLHKINKS